MECCQRIIKSNQTAFTLITVTFCVVLPLMLHHVQHSLYFIQWRSHVTKKDFRIQNTERLQWADEYLADLKSNPTIDIHKDLYTSHIDLVISVITVSRNRHQIDDYEPRYLTQTSMMLHNLKSKFDKFSTTNFNTYLTVCNVDHDVDTYEEAKAISAVIPVFNRFEELHFSMVHVLDKEKQDYVYCLNQSSLLKPKYVLLVEDDAIPEDDVFPVLAHTIRTHLDRHSWHGNIYPGPRNKVAFVKFYHPERLQSYLSADAYRLLELFSLSIVTSSLVFQLYRLIFIDKKINSFYLFWFIWFIYFMLVFLIIGHPTVVKLRTYFAPYLYSVRPAPSCCTPAMLFPVSEAEGIVNYMYSKQCSNNYGKDSVLDDMLSETGLHALYVEPNVFEHIGMYSALKSTFVDPLLV